MTPLALRIVKELVLPIKRRSFHDDCGLLRRMSGIHTFDCSAVMELADHLGAEFCRGGLPGTKAFLPAPRTWLEWTDGHGVRSGILLEEDREHALVRQADGKFFSSNNEMYRLPLCADQDVKCLRGTRLAAAEAGIGLVCPARIYALLAIINTPRLIGRKQYMPHRGLERALVRARPQVGVFPLRAWTELTLSVSAIMTEADGKVHEAHLTGERCLHFCRAHLRVRNGRLEQVKAHWRGNPALGIKQTRYRLAS